MCYVTYLYILTYKYNCLKTYLLKCHNNSLQPQSLVGHLTIMNTNAPTTEVEWNHLGKTSHISQLTQ